MNIGIWTLPRRWRKPKELTVNSDDERERREWSNNTGQMREKPQWTAEELKRHEDEIRDGRRPWTPLPSINYPRDLDKAPPTSSPQAFLSQRMSERVAAPKLREVDAITADLRANEKEIVRLENELAGARVREIDIRWELGQTLDEIERLAREARKTYKLEAPDVVQPPQAGPPDYGVPGGTDPGRDPAHPAVTPAGAGEGGHDERDQQGGRVAAVPHQERGDDEIPF